MITLIEATTSAVTSDEFLVAYHNGSTVVANGLGSGEEIELQIEYSEGSFTDVFEYTDQEQITLTSIRNVISICSPGNYRVVKPVTVAATTVGIHHNKA